LTVYEIARLIHAAATLLVSIIDLALRYIKRK
jgi:hypothetical protein